MEDQLMGGLHQNFLSMDGAAIKTTIPVSVEVDTPLGQTNLHVPFTEPQNVISPYYDLLEQTLSSWEEIICANPSAWWCEGSIP